MGRHRRRRQRQQGDLLPAAPPPVECTEAMVVPDAEDRMSQPDRREAYPPGLVAGLMEEGLL